MKWKSAENRVAWPCKEFAKQAFAGSLSRPPGGGVNLSSARRVRLPVSVEKPTPNYLRDGIFIVVVLLAVLSFELFSGTGGEVRTYNVPKEQSNPSSLIQFAKPEGWIDNTDASGLATLSFALPGNAGVSVIPLPARLAENPMIVNMWREQVGLGPVDEASVKGLTKPIMIGGSAGRLFDFAGTKPLAGQDEPPRIVSASLVLGQVGWFFKLSGSAGAIEPQVGAFTNFLATLRFRPAASEVNFDKLMAEAQQAKPPISRAPTRDIIRNDQSTVHRDHSRRIEQFGRYDTLLPAGEHELGQRGITWQPEAVAYNCQSARRQCPKLP